jgi:hypothetical protein
LSTGAVRRYFADRRALSLTILAVLVVVVTGWWLSRRDAWPFAAGAPSLQERLVDGRGDLADYRRRTEIRLRLQLLGTAIEDGRRSTVLRPAYRLLEDLLEPVLGRLEPQARAELRTELDGLLRDLSQDRSAALARIERMRASLYSPAGPGRQGSM